MTVQTIRDFFKGKFPSADVKVEDEQGNELPIKEIKQDIMRDVVIVVGD